MYATAEADLRAFNAALGFVLEKEGGEKLTDDPADPGGLTRWGVSLRAHPELGADGIRNLTRDEAAAIYLADYWRRGACEALPPAVAFFHFDCAVNQGVDRAAKLLQTAAGVDADGKIGPKTLAAASRIKPAILLREYAARRMVHYGSLSTFSRFGLGWTRRVVDCLSAALNVES